MTVVPRVELAPGYTISRLIKGGWQLAGGHGPVDPAAALADMDRFVDAGITTFDCADIYTGVEALIGRWLTRRASGGGRAARIGVRRRSSGQNRRATCSKESDDAGGGWRPRSMSVGRPTLVPCIWTFAPTEAVACPGLTGTSRSVSSWQRARHTERA